MSVPSGESVGLVSTPPASVTRVKCCHGGSASVADGLENQMATAANTDAAAIAHGNQAMRRETSTAGGLCTAAALDVDVVDNVSSANARSVADWNRRSGFFSRQRRTIRSTPGEIESFVVSSSGGSFVRIAVIVSAAVSALNARSPPSISYNTAPNAKMSVR